MEVEVKDGQTLTDIAIQEYGALEALPALAAANALPMSAEPEAGTRLMLPGGEWNRLMQRACKAADVSPATRRDMWGGSLRVFGDEFTPEFT